MSRRNITNQAAALVFGVGIFLFGSARVGVGTTLTWDGNTTVTGLQDGGGNWDTNAVNRWWTGSNYQFWNDANNDSVIFGVTNGVAGQVSLASPIVVQDITFNPSESGSYTIKQSGSVNLLTLAGTPVITVNADATINTALTGVAFDKEGAGTLTLAGTTSYPNTYLGMTTANTGTMILAKSANVTAIPDDLTINSNATVRLANRNQIVNSAIVTINGGTLDMGSYNEAVGQTFLNGGSILGPGGMLSNSPAYDFNFYSGVVTVNLGGLAGLVKSTSGTVLIAGTNIYAGYTYISDGILQLGSNKAIPVGVGKSDVYLDATLDLNGFNPAINGITGYGLVTDSVNRAASITIGNNDASSTFDGVIQDGEDGDALVSLVKTGGGVLTLTAGQTFTGTVSVNAGTLYLSGFGALDAASAITLDTTGILNPAGRYDNLLTLNYDQTLRGSGTVESDVFADDGSYLSPGISVGALTIYGTLTLATYSTTTIELNKSASTNDSIQGLDAVNYGGTLVINNIGGMQTGGESYQLFSAGYYYGSFDSISWPALPAGLSWTNRLALDGSIAVIGTNLSVPPNFTGIVKHAKGVTLSFLGVAGQGYRLWAGTNLVSPLTNYWVVLTNGNFTGGAQIFTDKQDTNFQERFYLLTMP